MGGLCPRSLSLCLCVMVLLASGCRSDRDGEYGSQDGASVVRLSEHSETFDAPLFRVGGANATGPVAFGRIDGVVIDSANRIWVGDDLATSIVRLDRTGRLLDVLGRSGQGPGEFLRVAILGWHGDSVVVRDDNQQRITFIDEASDELSLVGFERFAEDRPRTLAGVGSNGEFVFQPLDGLRGLAPGEDPQGPQWIEYAPARVTVETVGEYTSLMSASLNIATYFDGTSYVRHPLMTIPLVRVGGDEVVLVGSLDGDIIAGHMESGEVRVLNMSEEPGLPLDGDASAEVREFVERLQESQFPYATLEMVEAYGIPDRLPYFDRSYLSRDGVLWARRRELEESESRIWDVVSMSGHHFGAAHFQNGEDVVAANESLVVTVFRDEFGAQVLSAYRHSLR